MRESLNFKDVIDLSEDGIVIFSKEGILKFVNPAFLQITGIDVEHLLGVSECQFDVMLGKISSDDRFHQSAAGENVQNPVSTIHIKSLFINRIAKTVEASEIGKIIYFRDITKQQHENIAKSEFLNKVAHDLRTHITSIQGFSELLLSRDFDSETTHELLEIIRNQSQQLAAMINQVLEIARIENHNRQYLHLERQLLQPIIESAIDKIKVGANDTCKLAMQQSDVKYNVEADFDKLCCVVGNVIDNAVKFSAEGAEVNIYLKECNRRDDGNYVGIVVRDAGIGMTAEQIAKIFERFWRADTAKAIPGIGLGMSISKEIMDLHQGSIEVKSEIGRGAEVCLWLKCFTTSSD